MSNKFVIKELGRDLNPASPEYEAGIGLLTTLPRRLVKS
jgi:hypothetical protein